MAKASFENRAADSCPTRWDMSPRTYTAFVCTWHAYGEHLAHHRHHRTFCGTSQQARTQQKRMCALSWPGFWGVDGAGKLFSVFTMHGLRGRQSWCTQIFYTMQLSHSP